VLRDGEVTLDSFAPAHFRDPQLLDFMRRISVTEVAEFSDRFPAELVVKVIITAKNGAVISDEISHPRGHAENPMSDAEIEIKFERLISRFRPADADACRRLRSSLWSLDTIDNVAPLLMPLRELHLVDPE
jgi:2-methylcitrate dehydratase